MTTQKTIALSAVLATVISPILTLLIKQVLENRNLPSISNTRNLTGNWKGETIQENERKVIISSSIKSKRKSIKGTAKISWEDNQNMELKINGHFLDENYIHINYMPKDTNIKNFGSQILRISSNANKLEGLTIGYGSEQEHIISGKTILDKIN